MSDENLKGKCKAFEKTPRSAVYYKARRPTVCWEQPTATSHSGSGDPGGR